METEWITAEQAALILGVLPDSANRLAHQRKLVARVGIRGEAGGRVPWEFDRASVEGRAARLQREPAPEGAEDWLPIAAAQQLLKMTRHGIKRRIKMGLLESKHFGPPEKLALYVSRKQVEEQVAKPPDYPRRTDWVIDAERDFLIWFAGFFDGEGCIAIHRYEAVWGTQWAMETSLPNSAVQALLDIEKQIGGRSHPRPRQKAHYRDQRIWHATADEAMRILELIRPYLRVKHEQADLAMEFQLRMRAKPGHRYAMVDPAEQEWRAEQKEKISRLNRPNVPRD